MAKIVIDAKTDSPSMGELRDGIEAAIDRHFPPFMKRTWEGETLHLTGPGARGTMVLDSGVLKVRAKLKPPASMMRHVIEHKITAAFEEALGKEAILPTETAAETGEA
ncbi:MAG: polyhydroxyalkanoic acid system family protein [Acidobacteriota bacterium]